MTEAPAPPGIGYAVYAAATALAAPLIRAIDASKMKQRGVPPKRIAERAGHPSVARPDGQLLWFHAASVGEVLSVIDLIRHLGERLPKAHFLITTVTTTSADTVAKRRPPQTIHQYAPLDTPRAAQRFFDHWRPDLAVLVESEIWPQLLLLAHKRRIPLALVNARLSERSVRRWKRLLGTARALFGRFDMLLVQNHRVASDLCDLGAAAARVEVTGDLKSAASPLPVDPEDLETARNAVGTRPVWLASSTHPGEEGHVSEAHRLVQEVAADALLILAPRHPERGVDIAKLLRDKGFSVAQRSAGEVPGPEIEIWLVDTLGELGIWYTLSDIAFLGGSLNAIGGHNPYEPAGFGTAVLFGPGVFNFKDAYDALTSAGGASPVASPKDIADRVTARLTGREAEPSPDAARAFAQDSSTIRETVAQRLFALLELAQ